MSKLVYKPESYMGPNGLALPPEEEIPYELPAKFRGAQQYAGPQLSLFGPEGPQTGQERTNSQNEQLLKNYAQDNEQIENE